MLGGCAPHHPATPDQRGNDNAAPRQFPADPVIPPAASPAGIQGVAVPVRIETPEAAYEQVGARVPGPLHFETPGPAEPAPRGRLPRSATAPPDTDTTAQQQAVNGSSGVLGRTFDSTDFVINADNTGGSVFIPPDSHGAAGPADLVNVTNVTIRFHAKDGTLNLDESLRDFFSALNPANFLFDPKAIYDQHEDRFVVVALEVEQAAQGAAENDSRILVAVSDDSDPMGTWYMAALDSQENIDGDESWADFPGFAVGEDAVYITVNMFTFFDQSPGGVFRGVRLWAIAKEPASGFYGGGPADANRFDPYDDGASGVELTTQPGHVFGTLAGSTDTYLLGYSGLSAGNIESVQVVRVDDPLGSPTFARELVSIGDVDDTGEPMPDAPQQDSTEAIETNDRRALSARWRDDSLWGTFTLVPNAGEPDAGEATAAWLELDTTTDGLTTVADFGTAGGEAIASGTHTFFPAIGVNTDGDVAVGFSASADSIYPGSYYATRREGDPAGTLSAPVTLRSGVDWYVRTFGGDSNRWGDYSDVVVDPATQCLWIYNQHAMIRGTPTGSEEGRWRTAWGEVCLNQAPTAVDDSFSVDEDATVTGNVRDNDTDDQTANADLTVDTTPVTAPDHGSLTLNADGSFSYDHDGSETTTDFFEYEVCDDASPPLCDTGRADLDINPVNDPPTAEDDAFSVDEGATVSGDVRANDSDPETATADLVVDTTPVTAPQNGSLTLNADGSFSYDHDGSETTTDFFEYEVCDDASSPLCDTARADLTINPVNDPPAAADDASSVDEGATVSGNVRDNDSDAETTTADLVVTTTPVAAPDNGSLTLNADGSFSYDHDGSETTADSFEYEVCDDGSPQRCDTAVADITINPVDDLPVAADDSATVQPGGSVSVLDSGADSLLANDVDPDTPDLAVGDAPLNGPSNGSATVAADGTFEYTHADDGSTADSFDYEVCDDPPDNTRCDTATVDIVVNLPPEVACMLAPRGFNEGDSVAIDTAPAFTDPDGDDSDLQFSASGLPSGLSIDAGSGGISGTVDSGAAGDSPYQAVVTATDAGGSSADTGFTLRVLADGQLVFLAGFEGSCP